MSPCIRSADLSTSHFVFICRLSLLKSATVLRRRQAANLSLFPAFAHDSCDPTLAGRGGLSRPRNSTTVYGGGKFPHFHTRVQYLTATDSDCSSIASVFLPILDIASRTQTLRRDLAADVHGPATTRSVAVHQPSAANFYPAGSCRGSPVPVFSQVDTWRPPGAAFDGDVNTMVRDFDHVCPFTGTAIGGNNMKPFVTFTVMIQILIYYTIFVVAFGFWTTVTKGYKPPM